MRWSYKTVHFELKKEGLLGSGFLDESEIEQELNEYGRSGWELVSVLEVSDGMIAFFKQPFGVRQTAAPPAEETPAVPDKTVTLSEMKQETLYEPQPETAVNLADAADENDSAADGSSIGAIKIE